MTLELGILLFCVVWSVLYIVPELRWRGLKAANRSYAAGDFTEALRLAEADCKRHPGDWRPRIVAAYCLECLGRFEESLQHCNQSIALGAAQYEGYYYRMFAYTKLFRYEEALADSMKVLELRPGFADVYAVRFAIYLARHELELAQKEYDCLTALDLKSPALVAVQMELLALLHHHNARNDEAITVISDAVLLEPENELHLINRAWYLIEVGKVDLALADLEQAESLVKFPNSSAYIESNRARAFLIRKQIDEALSCAEKSLAIAHHPDFLCTRAVILMSSTRLEEARGDLQKAIRTDLYCAEAHWLMGRLLEIEGRADEAAPFLAKALSWNYNPSWVPF